MSVHCCWALERSRSSVGSEEGGIIPDVRDTSTLCTEAAPQRFALSRLAVELKFSSHRKSFIFVGAGTARRAFTLSAHSLRFTEKSSLSPFSLAIFLDELSPSVRQHHLVRALFLRHDKESSTSMVQRRGLRQSAQSSGIPSATGQSQKIRSQRFVPRHGNPWCSGASTRVALLPGSRFISARSQCSQ
jgi:hypothetical protein